MVHGYKAFTTEWRCRDKQYTCPGFFEEKGELEICKSGMHFCRNLIDCFIYYPFLNCKVAEVIAHGDVIDEADGKKSCTNKLEIIREIPMEELIEMTNTGSNCSGYGNTGSNNQGNHNSGNNNYGTSNVGSCNFGQGNAGHCNNGHCNTGVYNTGNWNTGNNNIGNRNVGDRNIGSWNVGNYNTGYLNSGDWNKTNCSTGCFNTEKQNIYLFNRPSNWTIDDWETSKAKFILIEMTKDSGIVIPYEEMTPEEKAKHPESEITRTFVRLKEKNHQEWWNSLSEENKEEVMSIPNFDPEIFKEITGIDTSSDFERRKSKRKEV